LPGLSSELARRADRARTFAWYPLASYALFSPSWIFCRDFAKKLATMELRRGGSVEGAHARGEVAHPQSFSLPRTMPRLGTFLNPPSSIHDVVSTPSNYALHQPRPGARAVVQRRHTFRFAFLSKCCIARASASSFAHSVPLR
jgi:hypothetical protein